jgi:hypothetical protein
MAAIKHRSQPAAADHPQQLHHQHKHHHHLQPKGGVHAARLCALSVLLLAIALIGSLFVPVLTGRHPRPCSSLPRNQQGANATNDSSSNHTASCTRSTGILLGGWLFMGWGYPPAPTPQPPCTRMAGRYSLSNQGVPPDCPKGISSQHTSVVTGIKFLLGLTCQISNISFSINGRIASTAKMSGFQRDARSGGWTCQVGMHGAALGAQRSINGWTTIIALDFPVCLPCV